MAKLYALVRTEQQAYNDPETKVIEIGAKSKCLKKLKEIAKEEPFEDFDPDDSDTWSYVGDGAGNLETFTGYIIDCP